MTHRLSALRSSRPHLLILLAALAVAACGGDDDSTTATVPGAPTIGAATAGNASASIAFTAPSSDGGATISGYTATCTAGADSITGTATASPVAVTGLTNDTAYSCAVTATNSAGTGAASASVSVTPVASASSGTAGVECSYSYDAFNSSASVNLQSTSSWTCDSTSRILAANGVPDHEVGTFPNPGNPNTISAQTVSATLTLTPTYNGTATVTGGPRGTTGYVLNGVKVDAGTAGSCPASATATTSCSLIDPAGAWSIEALGQDTFDFGEDTNNAHVQPTGEYHYHGMPEGFITLRGGGPTKMTLVGWAADGFPIYARYGYSTATDATSALKVVTGSYQLKSTVDATRPSTTLIPLGTFAQDWEYLAGSGDLDECNGRVGVTPEFPNGIYHYYATDSYPYFQRCIKGNR
jgi:YHYH protein/Fibronectin type III domain